MPVPMDPIFGEHVEDINKLLVEYRESFVAQSQRKLIDDGRAAAQPTNRHFAVLTCEEWLRRENDVRAIVMRIGPREIQYDIPMRTSSFDTKGGKQQTDWYDKRRGTHFGEGTASISFQSGNIMPVIVRSDHPDHVTYSPPNGLSVFQMYLQLRDAPRSLDGTGRPNYVILSYSSLLFPRMTLIGFFDNRLSFTDTGDSAEVQGWSAVMDVYQTFPQMHDASKTWASWMQFWNGSASIGGLGEISKVFTEPFVNQFLGRPEP